MDEYNRLKNNAIHMSGIAVNKCLAGTQATLVTSCSCVRYGTGLVLHKVRNFNRIVLSQMKRWMVILPMDKKKCLAAMTNIRVINTTFNLERK